MASKHTFVKRKLTLTLIGKSAGCVVWVGAYLARAANQLLAQLALMGEMGLVAFDAVHVIISQDVALAVQRILAVTALVQGFGHPGWGYHRGFGLVNDQTHKQSSLFDLWKTHKLFTLKYLMK